ncbi:MAG: hypothetical protein IIB77_13580 [Proteobacteria bacterium]|nr:hypothetical protein [Pseudomonadota bacterium]
MGVSVTARYAAKALCIGCSCVTFIADAEGFGMPSAVCPSQIADGGRQ